MTARNPTDLKGFFETADIPTADNYGDVFDSYINVVQTTAQTLMSDLDLNKRRLEAVAVSASNILANKGTFNTVSAQAFFVSALSRSVQSSVNATGTTLSAAASLVAEYNVVPVVSAGTNDGVRLGVTLIGRDQVIWNTSNTAMRIYPRTASHFIDALASGASFSAAAGTSYSFKHITSQKYISSKG